MSQGWALTQHSPSQHSPSQHSPSQDGRSQYGTGPFDGAEPPRGESGWRPTPAQRRATILGALGVIAALVTHRVDLLVLATPMLVVATWGAVARPRHTVSAEARIGNRSLPEGAATRWSLRLRLPAGAEQTTVRLARGPFVQPRGPDGAPARETEITRPARGGHTGSDTRTDSDATVDVDVVVSARLTRWGPQRIGPGYLRAYSPWWAYRTQLLRVGAFDVLVTPATATFTLAGSPPPQGLVGRHRAVRAGGGTEFANIRPFVPGDRLRRIHWPTSLRTGALTVSTTHADEDAHVVLVVDAFNDLGPREGIDGRPTSLDLTVRAAAALAEHHLTSGDRVTLRILGSQVGPRLPVGGGRAQLRRMLDVLARIEPATDRYAETVRGLDRLTAGSLVLVLTPLVHEAMAPVVARAAARGLTTVVVDTLPEHLWTDPDDPYAALAWRIRRLDRADEVHRLRAAGVPVVPWHGPGSLDAVLRDLARQARRPRLRVGR